MLVGAIKTLATRTSALKAAMENLVTTKSLQFAFICHLPSCHRYLLTDEPMTMSCHHRLLVALQQAYLMVLVLSTQLLLVMLMVLTLK
jgi:hypothetical protein